MLLMSKRQAVVSVATKCKYIDSFPMVFSKPLVEMRLFSGRNAPLFYEKCASFLVEKRRISFWMLFASYAFIRYFCNSRIIKKRVHQFLTFVVSTPFFTT